MWPGETGNTTGPRGVCGQGSAVKTLWGECSGEFLLWGLHQVKKDIIGDGKGHLIGALFLFKLK